MKNNNRFTYVSTNFPNYYWRELQKKGRDGRLKANAFLAFFMDKEEGNNNSARFYAETWGVGKTTVNKWIREFRVEIEKFDAWWFLQNLNKTARQYSSAKNRGGQSGQLEVDIKKAVELLNLGLLKDEGGQLNGQQVDKDIINKEVEEEEIAIAKEFDKLFFVYGQFSNRLGDREKGLEAYKKIRDEITLEDLLSTVSKYLTDASVKGKYNLQKFLSSKIFYSYLDRPIKIFMNDEWIVGRYSSTGNKFYTEDDREYPIDVTTLTKGIADNKIEFVGRVA